jgi:type VI secretion system protein ImpA
MNPLDPKLLEPISADQPCGPDLSNDPAFDELTALARGKPEVEIGSVKKPAEPPDWRELCGKSADFLAVSKNLQVAVMYACSLLKTEGVEGFNSGLRLLREWGERYWADLYPRLDPEDNNDPTQRLNILGALNASGGGGSWWITFIDNLYAAEICRPKGLAPVTFRELLDARAKGAGAPEVAKLTAAFEACREVIAARHQALTECLESAQGLDQFLTATLGAGNTISFEALQKTLRELLKELAAFLSGGAVSDSGDAPAGAEGTAGGAAAATAGPAISGSVRSRDDVVRALDRICEYYAQVEPGSPIPYILKRVQKMARMNFVQIMEELSLAKLDDLKASMGSAVEPPPE